MASLLPTGQDMCALGCHCALESDVLQGQKGISESEVRELICQSVPLKRGYI